MRINAQVFAGGDASNALQSVVDRSREAAEIILPTESGFTPPAGLAASGFLVAAADPDADPVCTGMQLTVVTTQGTSSQTGFVRGDGNVADIVALGPGFGASTRETVWVYRADPNGAPNPGGGTCLWIRGVEQGRAVDRALIRSVDTSAPGAVAFARPSSLPNQVTIAVRSSYFSPIHGAQTSDTNDRSRTITLTGRCVLLRNGR
jgi:hypothetical protein